jgi:hypothetical protein
MGHFLGCSGKSAHSPDARLFSTRWPRFEAEPGVDSIKWSRRCPASRAPAEQRSFAHRELVAVEHDDTSSIERVVPAATAWTLPVERSSQLS